MDFGSVEERCRYMNFCCVFAVDLVSKNLPKLKNLLWDASPDWSDLGLELGINLTTLRVIRKDNDNVTKDCFIDMLSKWLTPALHGRC